MIDPTRLKKIFPPVFPSDPVGAEFCKWFWSLNKGWDWILGDLPAPGSKARWITEPYPIQPNELWRRHQDKSELVGVSFKDLVRYIMLDIDRGSACHPDNDPAKYYKLLRVLRDIGLNSPVVIRSSWSEGLHVYYPLPKAVSSFGLACAVKWTLFEHDIMLGSGQIETFPNTKSYAWEGEFTQYKSHRLPLQPESGSYLLDASLEPYSDSVEDLLDEFNIAKAQQNLKLLRPVMEASWKRQALSRGFGSSSRAEKWRRHLEDQISTGWTAFSQTNSQIKALATYGRVFLRLDGRTLINYTVENALSAPGYERFCRHQHEIWLRAADWCKCVEAYYWPYGSDPSREGTYAEHFHRDYDNDCPHPENNIVDFPNNDKRSAQAIERIKQAIAHLSASGNLPDTATARSHAIIAAAKQITGTGISQTTLHKPQYLPLWHPEHDNPQASSCVIGGPEPIPAVFTEPEPDENIATGGQLSALKAAPVLALELNYTSFPYMKVFGSAMSRLWLHLVMIYQVYLIINLGLLFSLALYYKIFLSWQINSAPPKEHQIFLSMADALSESPADAQPAVADPEAQAPVPGEPVAANPTSAPASGPGTETETPTTTTKATPTPAVNASAMADPTAQASTPLSGSTLSRISHLRPAAVSHAQRAVRALALAAGRWFSALERNCLEQMEKYRFYWRSGEPVLMAEAAAWAAANPAALPEVGLAAPPEASRPGPVASPEATTPAAAAPTPTAPKTSAPGPADPPTANVPSPTDESLKVGERIIWSDCPAHCASWNPFIIIRIFDGMAWLDVYERPVLLSELRRVP